MNIFHVCKCGSRKIKLDSLKREGEKFKFTIKCECGVVDHYHVFEKDFLAFVTCPEVFTLFGPLKAKATKKQETLW